MPSVKHLRYPVVSVVWTKRGAFRFSGCWESYYATLKRIPKRLKKKATFIVEAVPAFKRHKVQRVLDLGCGAGRHAIYLAKCSFEVVGVDVSQSALKIAKKWARLEKLHNVRFLQATMTDTPFGNSQFDAVVSVSVIHHALKKDIDETINEIHRILRKNGLFLANLASVSDPRYGVGVMVEPRTFKTPEAYEQKRFEELHHYFTEDEVAELLACFSKTTVEPMHDRPNYWKVMAVK